MRIKYFVETDTLYVEFRSGEVAETRDLDENTLLDVDASGLEALVEMMTKADLVLAAAAPAAA